MIFIQKSPSVTGLLQHGSDTIEIPESIPTKNYMAIQLLPQATPIQGKATYATEFGM